MGDKKTAVVLVSGGLDSTTLLYQALDWGYKCFCLIFDYGQRHRREVEAAKTIAQEVNCQWKIVKFNLPWKGSSLLDRRMHIPRAEDRETKGDIPSTYVPSRNTIFLSFALSYAEVVGAETIFIGAHYPDSSNYPDCKSKYFRALQRLFRVGTARGLKGKGIRVLAPLVNLSKAEVIKIGMRLKVPYELTWSCYAGGQRPCLKCESCLLRTKGFKEARIQDPLVKSIEE